MAKKTNGHDLKGDSLAYYMAKYDAIKSVMLMIGKKDTCRQLERLYGDRHIISRYGQAQEFVLAYISALERDNKKLRTLNKEYWERIEELSQMELFESL